MENIEVNGRGVRAPAERAPAAPSPRAIRRELEKILASETFRGSEGQRNFLRFSVEQTLDGHADQLKEYSIGVQALERNEDFDPRVNPIVRTQASKLRSRLLKYYADEGLSDPVRIELPKGHYAPVFSASASAAVPEIEPPVARSWLALHTWKAGILLVLLAVTGTTAYLRGVARRDSVNSAGMNSIAVMPFLNIGGDKQDELFNDGLAEDLVISLARIHNLRVVARTSTLQFKDKRADIRTIGRTLNVRTVLEGSLRKSGNRLRITAQLIDTSSGYNLWSESYDRDLLDLDPLALQQDLSRAITSALARVNDQSTHR
jgi:TolB-like protein